MLEVFKFLRQKTLVLEVNSTNDHAATIILYLGSNYFQCFLSKKSDHVIMYLNGHNDLSWSITFVTFFTLGFQG